eukprot:gene3368-2078_t
MILEKMQKRCGIQGSALRLMESFLKGRRQRTKMDGGETSEWQKNEWGVPQGSVLGPILFVLACSDITEGVKSARIVQFADDVTLIASAPTAEDAIKKMNAALAEFEEWASGNWLAVEPTKTQVLYCTGRSRRKGMPSTACTMGGHEIAATPDIKILGFHLDEDLNGEKQCAVAAGKADRATWAIRRAAKYMGREERATLAEALAHPHLDYCQSALPEISATAEELVRRAYNRSARMAARTRRSNPALAELGWATWELRRKAVRAAMVTKIWTEKEPECLWELFPPEVKRDMSVKSMRLGELEETRELVKNSMGQKAFRVWAPRLYNEVVSGELADEIEEEAEEQGSRLMGKDAKLENKQKGKEPEDEYATQRKGYYAYLKSRYEDRRETSDAQGRVAVWTDGSAKTIAAFLKCIQADDRKLLVKTDSRYVHLGVTQWRRRWKSRAWMASPKRAQLIDNIDLWMEIDKILRERGEDDIHVKWVKGHGMPHHISAGLTTEELTIGAQQDAFAASEIAPEPGTAFNGGSEPRHRPQQLVESLEARELVRDLPTAPGGMPRDAGGGQSEERAALAEPGRQMDALEEAEAGVEEVVEEIEEEEEGEEEEAGGEEPHKGESEKGRPEEERQEKETGQEQEGERKEQGPEQAEQEKQAEDEGDLDAQIEQLKEEIAAQEAEKEKDEPDTSWEKGVVEQWGEEGWGWIQGEGGGKSFFVPRSAIRRATAVETARLLVGERVVFKRGPNRKREGEELAADVIRQEERPRKGDKLPLTM